MIVLVPLIIACAIGLVVGYYVMEILDFLIGSAIMVLVALLVVYQFYSPASALHQALPDVPVLFHDMPPMPTDRHDKP